MDRSTAAVRLLAGDKEPVRLATTANVPLVGLAVIDGITPETGDRVLVKDQTNATTNGIYTASVGTWRRAPDSARSKLLISGMKIAVQEGTANSGSIWNLLTDKPNVGTDAILFSYYLSATTIEQINEAAENAVDVIEQAADDFADAASDILSTAWAATNAADFASYAAAQLVSIPPGMNYFRTAGYYAAGDGGDELYRYNGTTTGDIVMSVVGGGVKGFDGRSKVVNAAAFGVRPANTAADNKARLIAALARTATNGRLVIPDMGAPIIVDTPDRTNAIVVNRKLTIQNDGHLKANAAAYKDDPNHMFRITAHSVSFENNGTIEGDGTILIGEPTGTTNRMPGMVYVDNVKNFKFRGGVILRQPMVGIHLAGANCLRSRITDTEFQGGPSSFEFSFYPPQYTVENPNYVGSAHFGIVASGGGDHTWEKLLFTKDDVGGGRVINGIFTSGFFGNSNGNKTLHCVAYEPWEKLLYGYGDYQVLAGCIVYGSSSSTHTEAYRFWGSFNRAYGNITNNCRGGMQILDGRQNIITDNQFLACRSTGINVQHFSSGYAAGIDYNKVNNNIITWGASALERRFAIRFLSNNLVDMNGCEARGNTIQGFGSTSDETEFAIQMEATSPRNAYSCIVSGNFLQSYGNGIKMVRCSSGEMSFNEFDTGTGIATEVWGGTNIDVVNNHGRSVGSYAMSIGTGGNAPSGVKLSGNKMLNATNKSIRGFTFGLDDNTAESNQFTNKPLVGAVTLTAGANSMTVMHGGIAPHATIDWINTTQAAAAREALGGFYTGVAGSNNFSIATGDGNNFGDNVGVRYRVIQ